MLCRTEFYRSSSSTSIYYLMVNLYIQLLNDKEITTDGRFKEFPAFGLTYKFI